MADMEDSREWESFRFYQAEWPTEGEVVMGRVVGLEDIKAYVALPEYADREAMLPYSELSSRRIRSVHKFVHVGQMICLVVTRVNPDKGYIDVSLRQVEDEDDRRGCRQRYNRGKAVQSIMTRVAQLLSRTSDLELEDLYSQVAWKLDTLHNRKNASYDVFCQAYRNPDVFGDLALDNETFQCLMNVINHRFSLKHIKIRADVQVMCMGTDGVDGIKEALRAGQRAAPVDHPVKIAMMAAPLYIVTCSVLSNQRTDAFKAVEQTVAAIEQNIGFFNGGFFKLQDKVRVVECVTNDNDDHEDEDQQETIEEGTDDDDSDIYLWRH